MNNILERGAGISSNKPNVTVMVVDDDATIRDLCGRALNAYRVIQAGSCQEALGLYRKESVDLILSDVMMPGGTGLELLRQVKIVDPNAIVIIMTGFADKEVILKALKEGADDFINKPLNLLQLKTSIENTLARKSLKEELASIRRADQLKSRFLSLISHKLRTPITGISLFLQNIQRGVYDYDDEIFRHNAALASEEAIHLSRLVADLLTFNRVMLDVEDNPTEECNLNDILRDLLIQARLRHGKLAIEIDFTPTQLPVLRLDKSKISFALYQVIDNAFKFSGEIGQVAVTTAATNREVCILISDSGVGIPVPEISKVFEKFYQIDPENTGQVRGFGLGLFYAREFIRQYGGGISLESEPGLGTTVTISLPLQ